MVNSTVKIIGDTVTLHGDEVARITVNNGTRRAQLVEILTAEDRTIELNSFVEGVLQEVRRKAEAGTIKLDELKDIFDKEIGD